MAERVKKKKRGSVGAEIFDQIEKIVADQKVSRSAAFRRLGEKTGRRPGTVAANYYRVARQRGVKLRKRARRRSAAAARQRGGRARQPVISRALAALEEAATLLRQHAAEVAELRQENARLGQIRRLVGKK
jgi:hypothetical protein